MKALIICVMLSAVSVIGDDEIEIHINKYQVFCKGKNAILQVNSFMIPIKDDECDTDLLVLALKKGLNKIVLSSAAGDASVRIQEYMKKQN